MQHRRASCAAGSLEVCRLEASKGGRGSDCIQSLRVAGRFTMLVAGCNPYRDRRRRIRVGNLGSRVLSASLQLRCTAQPPDGEQSASRKWDVEQGSSIVVRGPAARATIGFVLQMGAVEPGAESTGFELPVLLLMEKDAPLLSSASQARPASKFWRSTALDLLQLLRAREPPHPSDSVDPHCAPASKAISPPKTDPQRPWNPLLFLPSGPAAHPQWDSCRAQPPTRHVPGS